MINLYPLYIRVHGPRSYHLGFRTASGDVEYLFRFSDDDDNMVDYIDTGFNDATIVDEAKFFIYQTVFSFHAARQSSILKGLAGQELHPTEVRYLGEGPAQVFNFCASFSDESDTEHANLKFKVIQGAGGNISIEDELGVHSVQTSSNGSSVLCERGLHADLLQCALFLDQARYYRGINQDEPMQIDLVYKGHDDKLC
ncbi:MAG: hypothetical protein IPK73_11725 [Candidatus Obscuribacter sp.]|nr:hypothetical protein [Candidatus Obscuribacter sp.]MBK9281688.1 hypothetical protein [Candidatus Obscuribacter sp.]